MSARYDFGEQLVFSKGARQETDEATLKAIFPEAVTVEKTDEPEDRAGVDYVITLRRGARLLVDAKARDKGCRQFWSSGGVEVALETWSVMPDGKYETPRERAKVGWTLDESKDVDLILFTFDLADHKFAYVRPFPLLREAFRRNYKAWMKRYKVDEQDSYRWQSQCVFVPLEIVDRAIREISRLELVVNSTGPSGDDVWTG